jgi:hypothetical protein
MEKKEKCGLILRLPDSLEEIKELPFNEQVAIFRKCCDYYKREIFDILYDSKDMEKFYELMTLKHILKKNTSYIGKKEKEVNIMLIQAATTFSEIIYIYQKPWCTDEDRKELSQKISETSVDLLFDGIYESESVLQCIFKEVETHISFSR